MAKTRKKVPVDLENSVIYKSAKTCCVCRIPGKPVEVHHIDQNPANNIEVNLVAICRNCHDEAHTKHALSKNLTPIRLFDFKERWEKEVAERSSVAMLPRSNLSQAMWTYVNHQRLPDIMKGLKVEFDPNILEILIDRKVVDQYGIPIFQKPAKKTGLSTIYDRFDWDDSHRLHYLYTEALDRVIIKSNPIELGAIWTKTQIKSILSPGAICFCMRGFKFKSGERENGEEDRQVYARAKDIEVRFTANTRHMYGSSALYDAYTGNRFTATLMLIKNIAPEEARLVIRSTPLAMGAGFVPSEYKSPHQLQYGWAKTHA